MIFVFVIHFAYSAIVYEGSIVLKIEDKHAASSIRGICTIYSTQHVWK